MDEWLCGLLDTNFNLICEDDSCFEVGRLLVEMERIIKKKDKIKIEDFVSRLPKVKLYTSGALEQHQLNR